MNSRYFFQETDDDDDDVPTMNGDTSRDLRYEDDDIADPVNVSVNYCCRDIFFTCISFLHVLPLGHIGKLSPLHDVA